MKTQKHPFRFRAGVWSVLALVYIILAGVGCNPVAGEAIFDEDNRFTTEFGGQTVRLELAVTPEETRRGLMHRETLDADAGMLFIFPKPQRLSFWMRNTGIPLDIGYFDRNGVLREVYPLQPYDEAGVSSRSAFLQIALEVNQGWFSEHGITPGTRLDLDRVRAALEAAGHDPETFNLGSAE